VGQHRGEAGNVRHRPHHPQQQIDIVDGLVHQGAAAVERFGPLPAALVIILLRAPPFTGRFAQRQPSEAPGVHGGLEGAVGVAEARGEDGAELDPVGLTGFDDAIAALRGDLQRLLDHDMLAGFGGGDGGLQVSAARRGHDDDLHVGPGQGGTQVRGTKAVQRQLGSQLLGAGQLAPDQGGDARAGHLGQGAGVEACDHAAAHKREADHGWPSTGERPA
jgi:hypothetical protein